MSTRQRTVVSLVIGAGVFVSVPVAAATIDAASPSYASVSAAVSAAAPGDTVRIPAGAATWGSTLTISKGVTVAGAGIGLTVITSSIANKYTALVSVSTSATSGRSRLTGITFNGAGNSTCLDVSGTSADVNATRIDHNQFTNCAQYGIRWSGDHYGLIDHNQFVDNYLGAQVLGSEWYSWENFPLGPGTANYPYFEDNSFVFTGARTDLGFVVEGGQGGRYVFRHNTIDVQSTAVTGSALELFDAHGNQDPVTSAYRPNGSRGTLGVEIYDNTITVRASHRILNLRGGEAKVFNNTVTQIGGSGSYIGMTEYDGWSYHYLSSYPGYDPVKSAFFWNNKLNGSGIVPGLYSPTEDSVFIQENRDWFRPSYGLAAMRPASCSSGTYYASTDTETLYACQSNSTWAVAYSPYQYPHPLAGGASVTPPAPATNLRIVR
jgi:hypothetical protein